MKKFIAFSIGMIFCFTFIYAGAWDNILMGTRALSMGTAFTAVADDPSAIFYNPAGLTFQTHSINLSLEGIYIMPKHSYTLPSGTTVYSKLKNYYPQAFISIKKERWSFGFGVYCPYGGGGVDWSRQDLGYPLKAILGIYSFTPSIAYKFSEKLSAGINFSIYKGKMEVETENPLYGPMSIDESGTSYSAGFGILYRPNEKIGIGLSFRGPAKMKIEGDTKLMGMNFDSETKFNLPYSIELGISYRLKENFLISADVDYSHWSSLKKLEGKIKNVPVAPGITMDIDKSEIINYKNIVKFKVGTEYIFPKGIAVRAGVAYDNYARPDETLNLMDIDVDKIVLFGGIGYRAGKVELNFAGVYALGREREISTVYGGYPLTQRFNLNATIISLGIRYSY
ncbi:outer membrane protein transport protein [Candidatus Aminicenantes bacterium AC-335-K20]|jgi:long-chain fatty acid transport protein|nr:outer membrane protein transport protein [SCandidatus Aminicenantes bacterium Aminicenantia_JdfR_composite]MCP2596260.1 outer membrane protein transport protein [Candidatus Aminicenantes bacterium AC-335-G13]MCP2597835.1 outer membrane protein transport protein [Candidatus Aminicenantes bacterium AC-335-L06]MCP2606135.1 outer membrane protein transport protein [Candidatus Aminicenantes bacterium AC-708-I09]MCP2619543.1 outer membrane protein transport protein [Candidatus Aminicenantes bacter